jgi:hypothetical protein
MKGEMLMKDYSRRDVMLTTEDNPYDPFDEFDDWLRFDRDNGYNSLEYVARVAKTSIDLPDEDNTAEMERAIDSICFLNLTGNYKKVVRTF